MYTTDELGQFVSLFIKRANNRTTNFAAMDRDVQEAKSYLAQLAAHVEEAGVFRPEKVAPKVALYLEEHTDLGLGESPDHRFTVTLVMDPNIRSFEEFWILLLKPACDTLIQKLQSCSTVCELPHDDDATVVTTDYMSLRLKMQYDDSTTKLLIEVGAAE